MMGDMKILSHRFRTDLLGPLLSKLAFLLFLVSGLGPEALAVDLGPEFVGQFRVRSLEPGQPTRAFIFKAGDSQHILVAPGSSEEGIVWQYPVLRSPEGTITGFGSTGEAFATAFPLGDDGARIYWLGDGPSGVLFARGGFGVPTLVQLKTGSTTPDRRTPLSDFGFPDCCYASDGKTARVPAGFPGAGRIKMTVGRRWVDTTASVAADGTLNLASPSVVLDLFEDYTGQNFVFVEAGTAGFARASVLIAHSDGKVYAFEVNSNGDPIPATRRIFASDVLELGDRDPVTKQLLLLAGDPVTVFVVSPGSAPAPIVEHQEPLSGATFAVGSSVVFRGVARQSNGAIARVALRRDNFEVDFNDGPFITADGHVDYYLQAVLPKVPGEYVYQIFATSADGATGESAALAIRTVVVTNRLPVAHVEVLTPLPRMLCESVRLQLSGSDPDGVVRNLFVLEGAQVLGHVAGASGQVVLRDLAVAVHHLTVEAQDDRGGIGSADVTVTIVNPPFNTVAGDFGLDGKFGVCFTGTSGVTYEAEWASPVNGAWVWTGLGPRAATSAPLVWRDPASGNDRLRLYRVRRR